MEDSKKSYNASYNLFYPSISGRTSWSLDQDIDQGNLNFNLNIDLDIYQNFNRIEVLKKKYELGNINYKEALKYVEDQVTTILYSTLKLEQTIAIYHDSLLIAEDRFNTAQKSYDKGNTSRLEFLKSQASLQKLKLTVLGNRNLYSIYIVNLKKLLGIELSRSIKLNIDFTSAVSRFSIEDYINKAQSENIQIQILNKELEVARKIKKSDLFDTFLPVPTLSYGKNGSFNVFFKDENWNKDIKQDINIGISYNFAKLLPNSSEREWLRYNDLRISLLELRYKESLDDIQGEITNYVGRINTSQMKLAELETTLIITKEILDAVKEDYNSGNALYIELEDAEDVYRNIQIDIVEENYNYNHYIKTLKSMTSL